MTWTPPALAATANPLCIPIVSRGHLTLTALEHSAGPNDAAGPSENLEASRGKGVCLAPVLFLHDILLKCLRAADRSSHVCIIALAATPSLGSRPCRVHHMVSWCVVSEGLRARLSPYPTPYKLARQTETTLFRSTFTHPVLLWRDGRDWTFPRSRRGLRRCSHAPRSRLAAVRAVEKGAEPGG